MLELSDKQKSIFSNNVKNITSKDEQKVLDKIDTEIEKLEAILDDKPSAKMEHLINDAKFLLEILRSTEFPISVSSRKWIVFGLNYLIADFDIIPDSIPTIGYYDDALVLNWVMNIIDYDITRYKFYLKAKETGESGSILKQMIQGDGTSEVIIIPGLLSSKLFIDHFKKLVKTIKQSKLGQNNAGISILNWKSNYTTEFENTILMVDHELKLKPAYDTERFSIEWQQLKQDYSHLAKAFYLDLKDIKKQHPDKKISVVTLNAGTYVIDNPPHENDPAMIDEYFVFGGCSDPKTMVNSLAHKIKKIHNFHNPDDAALKFLFENFENNKQVVGLNGIMNTNQSHIHNINLKGRLKRHREYQDKLIDLINEI